MPNPRILLTFLFFALICAALFTACKHPRKSLEERIAENSKDTTNTDQPFIFRDGVHFAHADSVYTAQAGKAFQIVYDINFVNVPGFESKDLDNVFMGHFTCPKGMATLANSSDTYVISNLRSVLCVKLFFIKLIASKPGTYTIPEVTFTHIKDKYTAPPLKVVVK